MRWLAILAILGYRLVIRPFRRRVCLYDESCSAYGIRVLREVGLWQGLPRIRERIASCRVPAGACWVLDDTGATRLISVTSHSCAPVPQRALMLLEHEAGAAARAAAPPSAVR